MPQEQSIPSGRAGFVGAIHGYFRVVGNFGGQDIHLISSQRNLPYRSPSGAWWNSQPNPLLHGDVNPHSKNTHQISETFRRRSSKTERQDILIRATLSEHRPLQLFLRSSESRMAESTTNHVAHVHSFRSLVIQPKNQTADS